MANAEYGDNALIFTDEQLNITNWTKNMSSFPHFDNVYSNNINTLTYRGGDGYERIYTKITVEKNKDYTINIRFNSPTGFSFGGYSGVNKEQFFIMNREPSSSRSTHYTALSGIIAYSTNLDNNASDIAKDYLINFNSGNYTELYVVIDFGQIRDGNTIQLVYEIPFKSYSQKYLIYDRVTQKYYNITNNTLNELDITELTSQNFKTYGNDEAPSGTLLTTLQQPKIYYWQDSEDVLPALKANVSATPPQQTIITDDIDISDKTITGIEKITAEYTGNPTIACSFDDGVTWKLYNGVSWVVLSENETGMTMETLLAITTENWIQILQGLTSFKMRFTLSTTDDTVTNIVINFTN